MNVHVLQAYGQVATHFFQVDADVERKNADDGLVKISASLWLIRYREAIILTASARLARCHVTVPMTAAIRIQRRT